MLPIFLGYELLLDHVVYYIDRVFTQIHIELDALSNITFCLIAVALTDGNKDRIKVRWQGMREWAQRRSCNVPRFAL